MKFILFFLASIFLNGCYSFGPPFSKEEYAAFLKTIKPPPIEGTIICPETNMPISPLVGAIIDRTYYSPQNIFSCRADTFGQGKYIVQDGIGEYFAAVAFYSSEANFNKAEVLNYTHDDRFFMIEDLKQVFDDVVIKTLEDVDHAEGIKVLEEEFLQFGRYNALWVAVSVQKNEFLRDAIGRFIPATRGHLIFKDKGFVVILTNQIVSPLSEIYQPTKHKQGLKKDLLHFRECFHIERDPSIQPKEYYEN